MTQLFPPKQPSPDDTGEWYTIKDASGTVWMLPAGFIGFNPPEPWGRALFLHGWCSDGGSKSFHLRCLGFDVETPKLSNWWFSSACTTAQEAYDKFQPDVVVGSSRGGAVALNIDTGNTPLVLLAPAYTKFGHIDRYEKPNVVVIHSKNDSTISYKDSVNLVRRSKQGKLVLTGEDHRLNCADGRKALDEALTLLVPKPKKK